MAIKTRAQLITENNTDFPDNVTQLISPEDVRSQMNDTADSALFPEDIDDLDLSESDVTSTGNVTKTLAEWTEDIDSIDIPIATEALAFSISTEIVAATIPLSVTTVKTYNYAVLGDGGGAIYIRRASEPTYPGKLQSADGAWWEINDTVFNVRAFGAVGDGTTDDVVPIQDALDRAIGLQAAGLGAYKVSLPPGKYAISEPLCIFNHTPGVYSLVTLTFGCDASGYISGKQTEIIKQFTDGPGIFVQAARNVILENFTIRGLASSTQPTYEQLLKDSTLPWWNAGGCLDTRYAFDAGVVIDAFDNGGIPSGGGFPGFDAFYDASGYSSGVWLNNVTCRGNIVGVGIGVSPLAQQADNIHIRGGNFSQNKCCFVVGQDQSRGNTIEDVFVQGFQAFIDTMRYGKRSGIVPIVRGGVLGHGKWIILDNGGQVIDISDLYAESTWSLGFFGWNGSGDPVDLRGCLIKLINPATEVPTLPAIDSQANFGAPVNIRGGYIGQPSNVYLRPSFYNLGDVSFDGVALDGDPYMRFIAYTRFQKAILRWSVGGKQYGVASRVTVDTATLAGMHIRAAPYAELMEGTRRYRHRAAYEEITLDAAASITVHATNGTATFTSAAAALLLQIGDYIHSITAWNCEKPLSTLVDLNYAFLPIGKVSAVAGNDVTLIGVPVSFVTGVYGIRMHRLPIIRSRTIGTTTSASTNITLVSTAISSWVVGDRIKGTGIPTGAYVTAKAGTTLTISQAAAASGITELYDAPLNLEEASASAIPTTGIGVKGDFVRNTTPAKDVSNMVLRGWVCTVTGEPGTWEPQYVSATSVVVPADTLDTLLPGAGGAVTQLTSKATSVTLNKISGQITTHNASLAADTSVSFTLTNSQITAYDIVQTSIASGVPDGAYTITVDAVAAGSCKISIYNRTIAARGDIILINFVVIKGSVS